MAVRTVYSVDEAKIEIRLQAMCVEGNKKLPF